MKTVLPYIMPEDSAAKQAILKAALELFVCHGVDETSIRDLARKTGYSNPVLFKHFASKDKMASDLFARCYRHTSDVILADWEAKDFPGRLRETLERYLHLLDEDLKLALYVNENLRRFWPKVPASLRKRSLLRHMQGLIAEGTPRDNEDIVLLTAAVLGFLGQLARMLYFGEIQGSAVSQIGGVTRIVQGMITGNAMTAKAVGRRH
jgi:AcrR family transcriptional regulator